MLIGFIGMCKMVTRYVVVLRNLVNSCNILESKLSNIYFLWNFPHWEYWPEGWQILIWMIPFESFNYLASSIFMWYLCQVLDFCCGANDFSCLMKSKLDQTGKSCSFKNYDLFQAKVYYLDISNPLSIHTYDLVFFSHS